MRTLHQFIFIGIFVPLWFIAADWTIAQIASEVSPRTIDVFTTQDERPTQWRGQEQAQIRVLVLDGVQQLEATLSHALPADPAMAEREVLNRLQQLDREWQESVRASAHALVRAQQLGVEQYPAIVFDERWVIYGLTDLDAAIAYYNLLHGGTGT